MMYINQDLCINCGACEPACPTQAIRYDDELEGDDEKFVQINEQFFEGIDISKGGRKTGMSEHDAEYVAQLPRS